MKEWVVFEAKLYKIDSLKILTQALMSEYTVWATDMDGRKRRQHSGCGVAVGSLIC